MRIVIVILSNKTIFLWINLFFLRFAILELSKLHMYETFFDILQPFFGMENIHLHFMDCDSSVLSLKTENVIKVLKI